MSPAISVSGDAIPEPLPVGSVISRETDRGVTRWRVAWIQDTERTPLQYGLTELDCPRSEAGDLGLTHHALQQEVTESVTTVETVAVTTEEVREAVEQVLPMERRLRDGTTLRLEPVALTIHKPGHYDADTVVPVIDVAEDTHLRMNFRERLAEALTDRNRTVQVEDFSTGAMGTQVEVRVTEQDAPPRDDSAEAAGGAA